MGAVDHTHPAPLADVFALVTDQAFLESRCRNAGDRNISVTVETNGDETKVKISRDVVSDIPSFAKKLFEPTNRVDEETVWRVDGDRRRGRLRVVVGDRVTIDGTLLLEPKGDRCRYHEEFKAEVKVALIGKRLVGFVEGETEKAIRESLRFTDQELTERSK